LAKAQIELVNPEKSLVATIEPQAGNGGPRQFRYAPLSSGLEIIRKTLGQHEIATVQATAINQAAGVVNLTTVLAHSSGEWIASECPSARLPIRPDRTGWARPLRTRGATLCSRSSVLLVKMMWMRRISSIPLRKSRS
jgi:hypothetical protein